jgi:FlaA1/EpsC-like NDP-sugar epimerase
MKTILITGGTGSLGKQLTKRFINEKWVNKIIIYSRSEEKQEDMFNLIPDKNDKIRYCLGDIRDLNRLDQVMKGVNIVIHAAALKRVPALEYNPIEAVKTNINGSMNVIDSCVRNGVEKVIAVSTDKANEPVNLYGGTKFVMEKLFQSAHLYSKNHSLKSCCLRYGNVGFSAGSVIPKFLQMIESGKKTLPLTDIRMTRFWITLKEAAQLVYNTLNYIEDDKHGCIYVPKIPSFRIMDLIHALDCDYNVIGIREGEKLHEKMINTNEKSIDCGDYYKIIHSSESFSDSQNIEYSSDNNYTLNLKEIKERLIDG